MSVEPSFRGTLIDHTSIGQQQKRRHTLSFATLRRRHPLSGILERFHLFTDHNYSVFIFDPLSTVSDLSQTSVRNVLRWAVLLSSYNFVCYHVTEDNNSCEAWLIRWSAPVICRLVTILPLSSTKQDAFEWPSHSSIKFLQDSAKSSETCELKGSLWCLPTGQIWSSSPETSLHLWLCIISHCGHVEHRGSDAIEEALSSTFYWNTLPEDVQQIVENCIHFLYFAGRTKVPRLFVPAVHGTSSNTLLPFHYIDVGDGQDEEHYALMGRDDHSITVGLLHCLPQMKLLQFKIGAPKLGSQKA